MTSEKISEKQLSKYYCETEKKYKQIGGQIKPDRKVGKIAALRFHEKMLDIAKESLIRVPPSRRDYNVLTVCVSDETSQKIKKLIHELCEKIFELEKLENNEANQVFQVNIQLFPFTKPQE